MLSTVHEENAGTVAPVTGADAARHARQNAILETALKLLVTKGEKGLTTAAIAREARCSKESLYKWFGDREGLLAALVAYQAGKVRIIDEAQPPQSRAEFRKALTTFAEDLCAVLFSDVSLALNRLAIGGAAREGSGLGLALNEHGKKRIEARAKTLLEAGKTRGFIAYGDAEAAYQALYGLIIGDTHIRMLLGQGGDNGADALTHRARVAISLFERLFAAAEVFTAKSAAAPSSVDPT